MKERRGLIFTGIDATQNTDEEVLRRYTEDVNSALDDGYVIGVSEQVFCAPQAEVCTVHVAVATPPETLLLILSKIIEDIKGRVPELYQIDVNNKERMRKFSEMIESNGFSPSDVYMWLQIPSEDEKDCLF